MYVLIHQKDRISKRGASALLSAVRWELDRVPAGSSRAKLEKVLRIVGARLSYGSPTYLSINQCDRLSIAQVRVLLDFYERCSWRPADDVASAIRSIADARASLEYAHRVRAARSFLDRHEDRTQLQPGGDHDA
jgi:hypothetical protein